MTNGSMLIKWTPTTDNTVRYSIRWQNFMNATWITIATDVNSVLGKYTFTFTPLSDSPVDRWFCIDMQAVKGTSKSPWLSEQGRQLCLQLPFTAVVVPDPPIIVDPPIIPIPIPVPPKPVIPYKVSGTVATQDPTTKVITVTYTLTP